MKRKIGKQSDRFHRAAIYHSLPSEPWEAELDRQVLLLLSGPWLSSVHEEDRQVISIGEGNKGKTRFTPAGRSPSAGCYPDQRAHCYSQGNLFRTCSLSSAHLPSLSFSLWGPGVISLLLVIDYICGSPAVGGTLGYCTASFRSWERVAFGARAWASPAR